MEPEQPSGSSFFGMLDDTKTESLTRTNALNPRRLAERVCGPRLRNGGLPFDFLFNGALALQTHNGSSKTTAVGKALTALRSEVSRCSSRATVPDLVVSRLRFHP